MLDDIYALMISGPFTDNV